MSESIRETCQTTIRELLAAARLHRGDIVVIGCSSSEVLGEKIGTHSSYETAEEIHAAIAPILAEEGLWLAAQCCEHLNRALIIEADLARELRLDIVNVVPQPKAGGSFATCAYKNMKEPVAVEYLQADAGLDIGDTFIGMHIKPVAVPVRLSVKSVGEAHLTAVRRRPKSIGGERAVYNPDLK